MFHEHQIELTDIESYSSPSLRFNAINPMSQIEYQLNRYGATPNNKAMFQQMMDNEKAGFIGYHAGCSDYRTFQDVIKIAIEEFLGIPIRDNFQFLRVPGISDYSFDSADAFVEAHPVYNDTLAHIKKHILSINIALYKSWNADWDFTPRYFLQNRPWTFVYFENELAPFFKQIGVDPMHARSIFQLARQYVPQNKGMILQFFDGSHDASDHIPYDFLDKQGYIGTSGSKISDTAPSLLYLDTCEKDYFPQLRLVMNNSHTLNPYSPLIIMRYHTMTPAKEDEYQNALREFMRALPFDQNKADSFRHSLIRAWGVESFSSLDHQTVEHLCQMERFFVS